MGFQVSDVIAIVSTCSTLYLSFLVYRATVKSADAADRSAEATVKTTELTEQMLLMNRISIENQLKKEESYRNSLKIQYVSILLRESNKVLESITSLNPMEVFRNLTDQHFEHNITYSDLGLVFSEKDVSLINEAWNAFEYYVDSYYQKTYQGNEMGVLVTHADKPILLHTELKERLIAIKHELEYDLGNQ